MRSVAGGNETVPTVFVGSHAMVNPSMAQVLAAVRDHAPGLAVGAEPAFPCWQPVAAVLAVAVLWVVLAVRTPTTTYHLAPLLMAAAGPVTRRRLTGRPVPSRAALAVAGTGLAITVATTVVLAWLGLLAGPDLTGGTAPVVETMLLAVSGAAVGWWLARRGGRTT